MADDFLERNADILKGTSLDPANKKEDEEEQGQSQEAAGQPAEDEMDPDLKALQERNPNVDLSNTSLSRKAGDKVAPVGGKVGRDVTDEVQQAEQSTSKTHQDLYGDRPGLGPLDTAAATAGNAWDATRAVLGMDEVEPNEAQKRQDEVQAAQAEWDEQSEEIYSSIGHSYGSGRAYTPFDVKTGKPGETIMLPPPDSSATGRAVWQAGSDLYQQIGGLLTEGAVAGDSEIEQRIPDYDLSTGENLAKDIIAIGLPVGGTVKGVRWAGRGLRGGKAATATTAVAGGAADVLGASLAEAVMAEGGDRGMFVMPEKIEEMTKGTINGESAKSVAMILDGLAVNGVLDGLAAAGAVVGRKGRDVGGGLKKLVDKEALVRAAREGTALDAAVALDPEMASLPKRQLVQRLGKLSEVLNQESVMEVAVGETAKPIKTDSMTAIMNGSEAYVRETRQNLRDTMSDAEFEEMVQTEAANMTSRMVSLLRGQQSSSVIRDTNTRLQDDMASVFGEEADRIVRQDGGVNTAAQASADNLAAMSTQRQADIEDDLLSTEQAITAIDERAATVLQDNPVVAQLKEAQGGGLSYNDEQFRQNVNRMIDKDVYGQFVKTADEVDAAYAAIPNVEIDAGMLKGKLDEVVAASNSIDDSGRKTGRLVNNLLQGFTPRKTGTANDPMPVVGESPRSTVESGQDVLDRIEGEVGFQDLYKLKANLGRVIDTVDDPDVKGRLIDLRNHITSEDGQLGYVMAQGGEAAEKARAADMKFKELRERFYGDRNMEQLSGDMEVARQGRTTVMPGGSRRGMSNVLETGQNTTIPTALNDRSGEAMANLRRAIGEENFATASKPMQDYLMSQGSRNLIKAIENGDVQSAQQIFAAFDDVRPQLQKMGSDIPSEVEELRQQVLTAEGKISTEKASLEAARDALKVRQQEAQEGILGDLLSTYEPGASVSDPMRFFGGLITRNDSSNAISALRREAANLPEGQRQAAERAIQASALKSIETAMRGSTPVGMSGPRDAVQNFKLGQLDKLSKDQAENLQNGLRAAFDATPEVAQDVAKTLEDIYVATIPTRLKVSQAGSDTAANLDSKNMRDALSTSILFTMGYMNPKAAAARRISASAINAAEKRQAQVSNEILERITSSPTDFATFVDEVKKAQTPSAKREAAKTFMSATGTSVRENARVDDEERPGGSISEETEPWLR